MKNLSRRKSRTKKPFQAFIKASKPAVTLIEMIVVITVAALIMGISVNGVQTFRKRATLKEAVSATVGLLQNARSQAVSNLEVRINTGVTCEANAFYVTTNTLSATSDIPIQLYAELSPSCYPSTNYLLESYTLPASISLEKDPTTLTQIRFVPPDPNAVFTFTTPPAPEPTEVTYTLQTADGGLSTSITVSAVSGVPTID